MNTGRSVASPNPSTPSKKSVEKAEISSSTNWSCSSGLYSRPDLTDMPCLIALARRRCSPARKKSPSRRGPGRSEMEVRAVGLVEFGSESNRSMVPGRLRQLASKRVARSERAREWSPSRRRTSR